MTIFVREYLNETHVIKVSFADFQQDGNEGSYVCDSKCRKHILKMQATLPKKSGKGKGQL